MQFLLSAIAIVATAIPGASKPDNPPPPPVESRMSQDAPEFGWCHDVARGLVSRRPVDRCEGKLVDETEAARLQQERDRKIMRALPGPGPILPGHSSLSSGSGFVVSLSGHVLTNYHVVEGCGRVSVVPAGGRELVASVVATDPVRDLALVRAPIATSEVAPFSDGGDPPPSTDVAVAGYPDLGLVAIQPVLQTGHVHIGGNTGYGDRFLLKVGVRHGNSGGPVLDRAGRVVGVVVAKVNTPAVYAETGRMVHDVALAIRPHVALEFLAEHGVTPAHSDQAADLDDATLLSRIRGFVARVRCWR